MYTPAWLVVDNLSSGISVFSIRYIHIVYTDCMKVRERELAIQLRVEQKLGYGEISKRLNVPKSTLSAWLKEYPLSEQRILELRREAWSRGESKKERFRETMRKRREERDREVYTRQKARLGKLNKQSLFVAGLMLYLAEGSKKNDYSVVLANTDARLIHFFVWWMQEYLQVKKDSLRIQLHLYENRIAIFSCITRFLCCFSCLVPASI